MPAVGMRVKEYLNGFADGVPDHRWVVDCPGIVRFEEDPSPIGVVDRCLVTFAPPAFDCSCTSISPGAIPPVCDHIQFVARHIVSKSGPWESDGILMTTAWELVKQNTKREYKVEPLDSSVVDLYRYQVIDLFSSYWTVVVYFSDQEKYFCDSCNVKALPGGEGCEHIEAVRNAEREQDRLTGKKARIKFDGDLRKLVDAYMPGVVDALEKKQKDEAQRLYKSALTWKAEYKLPAVDSGSEPDKTVGSVIGKTPDGLITIELNTSDEGFKNGEAFYFDPATQKFTKANPVEDKESEEQPPPDEPRKPLGRFQDLDL